MPTNPAKPVPPVNATSVAKPAAVLVQSNQAGQAATVKAPPKETIVHVNITSAPSQVPVLVQYGAPFATAFAAIIAATIAGRIAVKSINAARENLILQMNAQRAIAAKASRASVVSANRQKWIDGVREDLADFIAADYVILDDNRVETDELSEPQRIARSSRLAEAVRTRRTMQRRIQLRLNPEKDSHKALYKAVLALIPATGSDHKAARNHLITTAQAFLRLEWLRVKAEAGEWDEAASSKAGQE